HLHRARLFDDRTALAAARKLIDEIGYERRRGELDDAQCRLDGRAVVLPEFASVLAQARGEGLPEIPAADESAAGTQLDIGAFLQQLDEPALEALLQQIDDPEARTAIRSLWEQVRQNS
ncbi:MAG TPA: hypothetical protein PKW88_15825, partial [Plasticicumulans sp.]|nr:hypothetical protein [Plasticicumulans sp.]